MSPTARSTGKPKKAEPVDSQCEVTRGEVDLDYYAARDEVWRQLGIAAPARRALVNANILTVAQLRKADMAAVAKLHGMGPKSLRMLETVRESK